MSSFFSSSSSSGNPTAPPAALSNPRLVATAVARCSWLVKACHYTRKGCDEISQRAAQGSLYRGAGRQRRSERLKVGPYAQGRGRVFFLQSVTSFSPIACMRYRRGRPKHANTSGTGRLPGRMATAGGPLRAEGFPKRRC